MIEDMLIDNFLWRALLGGIGVALVAGPLGSFIIWRRMAYFGDSLAHSALLGVALGFALGIDLQFGVLAICVILVLMLLALQNEKRLGADTLLVILAYSALSIGLVAVSFMESLRVDLLSYLFGDILAVAPIDLAWIYGGGAVTLALLVAIWRPLLAMTVHEELARAEGVPVTTMRFVFMLAIALVIAIAMKIIGILLITSLLIIPAAAARRFARTPEQMATLASVIGCLAVAGGLAGSLRFDTPSGPSIVTAAAVLFLLSFVAGGLTGARR